MSVVHRAEEFPTRERALPIRAEMPRVVRNPPTFRGPPKTGGAGVAARPERLFPWRVRALASGGTIRAWL
jgi:hypothetical protein